MTLLFTDNTDPSSTAFVSARLVDLPMPARQREDDAWNALIAAIDHAVRGDDSRAHEDLVK